MANKRKKSYKRDTVAFDRAESKLSDVIFESGDEDIIDEVLRSSAPEAHEKVKGFHVDIRTEEGYTVVRSEEAEEKASPVNGTSVHEASASDGRYENKAGHDVPAAEEVYSAELAERIMHDIEQKNEREAQTVKAAPSAASVQKKEKKTSSKKKGAQIKPLKPIFSIANIVYTAVLFSAAVAAFAILPRGEVSETEQRKLAQFPEFSAADFIDGEYTNGITNYFNDNVPYRDDLKRLAAQIRNLYGVSYNDAQIIGPVAVITEETEDEPEEIPPETTPATSAPQTTPGTETHTERTTTTVKETTPPETEPPEETTKNVNEIAEGVITNGQVVAKFPDGHYRAISLFGGGKGTKYAAALNRFKEELGDEVNVYSMPVPTAGEYYLPSSYDSYNASHQKSIDSINSQLSEGVIPVPASKVLGEHADEDIYLRTDHHWQPLGAYYAAQCFAETAGVPFSDISTMERVDIPGYMGTMYSFTESADLLADPEVFTYYKPSNQYKAYYYDTSYHFDGVFPFFLKMPVNGSYSTFMGGDKKIVRISTDAGTGRKLVIFKDSYGNAEIPFFFGSFDEIYVCDMRYFDLNAVDFVKFTGATDLLFTMCTFSAVGTNAKGLDKILDNPVSEITESNG